MQLEKGCLNYTIILGVLLWVWAATMHRHDLVGWLFFTSVTFGSLGHTPINVCGLATFSDFNWAKFNSFQVYLNC